MGSKWGPIDQGWRSQSYHIHWVLWIRLDKLTEGNHRIDRFFTRKLIHTVFALRYSTVTYYGGTKIISNSFTVSPDDGPL
jgi:hypothetical protein